MKNVIQKNKKLIITILCLVLVIVLVLFTFNKDDKIYYMSKDKLTLVVSDTDTLTLNDAVASQVSWESSDSKIASVSSSGLVKGVSQGIATITAKYQNKKYSCSVNVTPFEFTVDEKVEVKVNEAVQINVEENSANGPLFTSKDISIASVDENGTVKGLKAGETEILVKLNDAEKTVKVTVLDSNGETVKESADDSSNSNSSSSSNASSSTSSNTKTDSNKNGATNVSTGNKVNSGNTSSSNKGSSSSGKPSNGGSSSSKPSNGSSSGGSSSSNKPSNGGGSSSSSGGSGNGSSNNGGNSNNKPAEKPSEPEKPVTYSYYGKTAYNYVLNQGGTVIDGNAYLGHPDIEGVGGADGANYLIKVINTGSKSVDYTVYVDGGYVVDNSPYVRNYFNYLFPSGHGSKLLDKVQTGFGSIEIDGRKYTISNSKLGFKFVVSPKIY